MNPTRAFISTMILMAALACFSGMWNSVSAEKKPKTVKIGTYDSRIVVLAYSRSDLFEEQMKALKTECDALIKDTNLIKRNEGAYKMITFQYLNHQMVFCSGSAAAVLDLIKDKLPDLAKETGVSMVVSKWELNYSDPSVEIVDLTTQVANLFNPKENIDKYIAEFAKMDPIPLLDLTVEEVIQMWNGFEARYKK